MMRKKLIFLLFTLAGIFVGCNEKDIPVELDLSFNFEESMEGWSGDFADYPALDSIFYELAVSWSSLPPGLDEMHHGIKISGNNHSDDLFMFIKKEVGGLRPNTDYQVRLFFLIGSDAPAGSVGIGGSPGESVYLKAGATLAEPGKMDDGNGIYIMNIDKGNQAEGGSEMTVTGNIAVSETATGYELISRISEPINVRTGDSGILWLIAGTDSGFEGATTLYYDEIRIILRPR